jgi:shikimate kinase
MIGPPGAGKTMLAKRLPNISTPFTSLDNGNYKESVMLLAKLIDMLYQRQFNCYEHLTRSIGVICLSQYL